jgi:hypothetical protein
MVFLLPGPSITIALTACGMKPMKISFYSNTAEGWDYFASLGFQKEHRGKCVGCNEEMPEGELWKIVRGCFEKGFAIKMYRASNPDVDVVVSVDDNRWKFRQRNALVLLLVIAQGLWA